MPAEARGTSEKSAKAFAEHYFMLLNYATATGDTDPVHGLATLNCESCANFKAKIDKIYRAGGHIRSDGWELQSVKPVARQPDSRPILQLGMLLHSQRVLLRKGGQETEFKGGKQPMTMFLVRSASQWKVSRLDLVV